ncbi:MAG: hypothetical protein V3T60_00105, partial [Candidatus Binatia bacterium]
RPRRRLNAWCAADCALRWARGYRYPDSIPHSPPEGLSIAEAPGGVKTLRQAAPWLSRAGL